MRPSSALLAAAILLSAVPAFAGDPAPKLSLELNALQASDKGCRVTLLATNGLATPIDKATFELAIFGATGDIDRLVSLDFKALPKGKTKVLQFDLKDLNCDDVSRILVNDVTACDGSGLTAASCLSALAPTTRSKVAFGQ